MKTHKPNSGLEKFSRTSKKVTWRSGHNIVTYTRVSSYEQAMFNTSLESQRKSCIDFAERRGLCIKQLFGGTYESAKNDERKEFKRMIEYVRNDKSISAILVYSYERFSRSENAGYLTQKLETLGVKVLSVFQDVDVTTPSGKLQQNIFYLFGNYDNELRKDKVVKGMIETLRQGYWVATTPWGYTNQKPKYKAREHEYVINKEGEILKNAFKWKAEGKMSNLEIVQKMHQLGSKIKYKSFVGIISNPFYCGYITHSLIPNEIHKGKHPALVSEALFLKANKVVQLNPHKGISKRFKNDELPLKSFARDAFSNSPFTGYMQKGIYYYKTRAKGSAVNIRAQHLNELFIRELETLTIDKKYANTLEEAVRKIVYQKMEDKLKEDVQLKRTISEIREKIEKLEMRLIDGEINKEFYEKYRQKFEAEIAELGEKNPSGLISSSNLEKAIEKGIKIVRNPVQLWLSSDYDDKQKLQYLIYPDGLLYNKQKDIVRTPKVNSVFAAMAGVARVLGENKKGSSGLKSLHSRLVVPTGIEPVSKV